MEPFGGLFGCAPIVKTVEQLVADPHDGYTPEELAELTSISVEEASDALEKLITIGLVKQHGKQYYVNTECNRYIALSMLAYDVVDDIWGTTFMSSVLSDYLNDVPVTSSN